MGNRMLSPFGTESVLGLLVLACIAVRGERPAIAATTEPGRIHVALLEPECIAPNASFSRRALTAWLDTVLTESLSNQKDLVLVDRQALDKVLAEKKMEKLDARTTDAALRPFVASGVLICPTIVVDGKSKRAIATVQAVLAQSGALLSEAVVTGELVGDTWKQPPEMDKALKVFCSDLRQQLAVNVGRPSVEISHVTLGGKVDRLQWLADDLTDTLLTQSYDGVTLLIPRQPVHTKEERLLRLIGLSAPAAVDHSSKLAAASDWQLSGELTEEPKPGVPFGQTPVKLVLHLAGAGKAAKSTTLIGTVDAPATLRQQAVTWVSREMSKGAHTTTQAIDDSEARLLARGQLEIAKRLGSLNYGRHPMETARKERLAMAALRACHLDPTSEEAGFLAVTTIEGLYQARGQDRTLACKDRILQLGQQYLERFKDKLADHHYAVLNAIGSAGSSAVAMIHSTVGNPHPDIETPDPRQYPYARAYVAAWMEVGIRGASDKRYALTNSLQSAPGHLQLRLIPNIPDDKLDAEYTFWRDMWTKRVVPLGPGKAVPWESIDVAFQARRRDAAAVRVALQKLADMHPATDRVIWRLLADDIVPLYLRAAGDKEWETWRPKWPPSSELVITREQGKRFYERFHVEPLAPWDLSQSKPLPIENRLIFDAKVLDTGSQRYVCPYPRIQPLFAAGGDLWFITPGLWDTVNLKQSHTLFVTPLAGLTAAQTDIRVEPHTVPWPALPKAAGATTGRGADTTTAPSPIIMLSCFLAEPAAEIVVIGTADHGVSIYTREKDTWQGRWLSQHDGLPAGAVTAVTWEKSPTLLRIEGLSPEVRRKTADGLTTSRREPWRVRYDIATRVIDLLPEPKPAKDPLSAYTKLVISPKSDGPARHFALQCDKSNSGANWELGEVGAGSGKFLPACLLRGSPTTESLNRAYLRGSGVHEDLPFLPLAAPLHETRLAVACEDSLLIGSFLRHGDSDLANRGEATHLCLYRPAPAGDSHPTSTDSWTGPFHAPDRGPIFFLLNDGTGNLWITSHQSIYRIATHALLAKLTAGPSTDDYRAAVRKQLAHADWRLRLRATLAEGHDGDALKIADEILAPLASVGAEASADRRDDWAVVMLYKAHILAAKDQSRADAITLYRQVLTTAWANPSARSDAADALLTQLHRAGRWQDLLDSAEIIRPLFPKTVDASDRTLTAPRLIKDARARLSRKP